MNAVKAMMTTDKMLTNVIVQARIFSKSNLASGAFHSRKQRFWPQSGNFGAISTPLGALCWRVLHLG